MTRYSQHIAPQNAPQSEPIPGREQEMARNDAGGYAFQLEPWKMLDRFLILGSDGGTYYVNSRTLTLRNAGNVAGLLKADGLRVVQHVVEVSQAGRAPDNDPALFVLAMAASIGVDGFMVPGVDAPRCADCGEPATVAYTGFNQESGSGVGVPLLYLCDAHDRDLSTVPREMVEQGRQAIRFEDGRYASAVRKAALDALPLVARTGEHLFHFAAFVDDIRGWGRGLREAVGKWYNSKSPRDLGYQLAKYQQRDGWSHRDLLRLAHPKPATVQHNVLLNWSVNGWDDEKVASLRGLESTMADYGLATIYGMERIKRATSVAEAVRLILDYRLTHEMVPGDFKKQAVVWDALLREMPMAAMIRNLATMTRVGLLAPFSDATKTVTARLGSDAVLRAKVHPLKVLNALKIYGEGRSFARARVRAGDVPTWTPVQAVLDALDAAFYTSFGAVEPTGKNWLIALDVSGSMSSPFSDKSPLRCCEAAAAIAMVAARTEANYMLVRFNAPDYSQRGIEQVPISAQSRLTDVLRYTKNINGGGTDCALPMTFATQQKLPVDTFVVITDGETWAGRIHPSQALKEFRRQVNPAAKSIVVAMTSSGFSIADPSDPGMLDVVGFDTATPQLMSEFARM